MIEIGNLAEFQRGLADWLKGAEETALNVYRGLAAYGFSYIVEETPQYTGESVANWRLGVGAPEPSYSSGIKKQRSKGDQIYQKAGYSAGDPFKNTWGSGGNATAMRIAKLSMSSGLRRVKSLDEKIYITNATTFGKGDRTVGDLESGGNWLREVNRPGRMIGRAVSYVSEQFAVINAANLGRIMRSFA